MSKRTFEFSGSVEDYKALYELILAMSFDVEGLPLVASGKVSVVGGGKTEEECKQCLSLVAGMLEIMNDVPAIKIEQANEYYHLNIEPYGE